MKKLILFFSLLFSFFTTKAQYTFEQQYKSEVVYIPWRQELTTGNCQPSFFWSVTRNKIPNSYGQFYYKVYFQTNSRFCDGTIAATYISGINFYVNNTLMNPQGKYWVLFREIFHLNYFGFWSVPNPRIGMTWDYITIN